MRCENSIAEAQSPQRGKGCRAAPRRHLASQPAEPAKKTLRPLRLCDGIFLLLVGCAPAPALKHPELPATALPDCQPNLDGRITKDELPFVIGAVAHVRVGHDLDVSTRGDAAQGSKRSWDLSRPDPTDEPEASLSVAALEDQWFAAEFPDAELVGALAADGSLLGALTVDDDGVLLYGSASKDESPDEGKTLLAYDEPALLYPFPIEVGAHAETTSTALNGTAYGIPVAFADTTTVDVTAHGEVILPDLVLEDAMRVTVRLERVPVAGVAVQQVTHVFVNECLGEVARMVSPVVPLDEELPDEFPHAAEVWRLAF